jgi:hypothetical protein
MLGTVTSTELLWFSELKEGELFRFAGQVSTHMKTGANEFKLTSLSFSDKSNLYYAIDSELCCRVARKSE